LDEGSERRRPNNAQHSQDTDLEKFISIIHNLLLILSIILKQERNYDASVWVY